MLTLTNLFIQNFSSGGQEMSVLIDQTMGESEPSTSQAAGFWLLIQNDYYFAIWWYCPLYS